MLLINESMTSQNHLIKHKRLKRGYWEMKRKADLLQHANYELSFIFSSYNLEVDCKKVTMITTFGPHLSKNKSGLTRK